jgi:hypothetical protein
MATREQARRISDRAHRRCEGKTIASQTAAFLLRALLAPILTNFLAAPNAIHTGIPDGIDRSL